MAESKINWIDFFKEYNKIIKEFQSEMNVNTAEVSVEYLTYYLGKKSKRQLNNPEEVKENDNEGFLIKLWNKTVFPDKIKAAKEEKALKREIEREARQQAIRDSRETLVEHYKQKEIDKITGKNKQDKLQKFADSFSMGSLGSTDKINSMLGNQQQLQQQGYQQQPQQQGFGPSNNELLGMIGRGQTQQPQQQKKKGGIGRGWDSEEKLKELLR